MKSTILSSIALTGLLVIQAASLSAEEAQTLTQDKKFGVGLMLGQPTGASLKYWLSDVSAIDGVVGLSLDDIDFSVHADYLYHFNNVVHLNENRLAFYVGGGPRYRVREHKDDLFGIRTVGGVAYIFDKAPVDVFFEVGPVFDLTPDLKVRYTVGIGARFWF